jgi:anti-sigma factor ChrR (cupin superfamily)
VLYRSLKDLISIELKDHALGQLPWRDFGNGVSMARLARGGSSELLLYRIRADASQDAFLKHEHIGGEFYLVLKGKIADETGEYEKGDVVFLDRQSVHTPRAIGETVVLVLWPDGVRIID